VAPSHKGLGLETIGCAGCLERHCGPNERLLDLVASLDFTASADHRLADLNHVAACDLWH
jgi:hypothetical protein